MRTQNDIVQRFRERKGNDFFGFEVAEYITFMEYEHAKEFIKVGLLDAMLPWPYPINETPRDIIVEYLPFAWDKANNCRGLSSVRSIGHLIAWLWMDESDITEDVERLFDNGYEFYGKNILILISIKYEFQWEKHDNGRRVNSDD